MPGRRYVIQVQAADVNGYDEFENNGFSEVSTFSFGNPSEAPAIKLCKKPSNFLVEKLDEQSVQLTWQEANTEAPIDYLLSYKTENEGVWTERMVQEPSLILLQLAPAKYQFRVSARCSYGNNSAFTQGEGVEFSVPPVPTEVLDETNTYYHEDEPETPKPVYTPEPESEPAIDVFNTPIKILIEPEEGDTTKRTLPKGYENLSSIPVISDTTNLEQLKTALQTKKVDCVALLSNYSCGQNEILNVPTGDIIQVKTGDEIAINSIGFEVVNLDGAGNGSGIVKMQMFGNAKFGVEFEGIKVAKGGCVVAGQAKLSHVDVALLSEEQRKRLAETYAEFNRVLTAVDNNAEAVAETINSLGEFIQKLKKDVDNYVGGKADAKKMKVNFKAAEKYATKLLENKNLSDSTRQKLKRLYDQALLTKDFFCNGKECIEAREEEKKKGGPAFEEIKFANTQLCKENKAKLAEFNAQLEEVSQQVVNKKCKPYDDIEIWGQVEITTNTVVDRGSVKSIIANAIAYEDCSLLPNYCADGTLVGYTVSFFSKDKRFERILLQVGVNQVENFKKNYNRFIGASTLYYMNGEPSEGMKKMSASISTQDFGMTWEGLKQEWKDCLLDPVCAATIILSTVNGVISVYKPTLPKVRAKVNDNHILSSEDLAKATKISDIHTLVPKDILVKDVNSYNLGNFKPLKLGDVSINNRVYGLKNNGGTLFPRSGGGGEFMDVTKGQAKAVEILKKVPLEKQGAALKGARISELDTNWAIDFIKKY